MKTAEQKLNSWQKKLVQKEQILKKVQDELIILEKKLKKYKHKERSIKLW